MNSNLEETIAYYQKIVDYLQTQMDESVAEFDFDSAKALTKHLFHARAKLGVLQRLKNPNHSKIMGLKRVIDQIESGDYFKRFDFSNWNLYPELKERQIQSFKERTEKRLQDSKRELKNLLNLPIKHSIDDEKVVVLLEEIILNKIKKFELEIRPEEVYLEFKPFDKFIVLTVFAKGKYPVSDYYNSLNSLLGNLGFEQMEEDYTLKREMADIRGILETLSILIFEVFKVRSDTQMNVIVYD